MTTISISQQATAQVLAERPPIFEVGERRAYFTILSYNTKGLPKIAGVDQKRYHDIGLEIKKLREKNGQPSIVLLQEAFVNRTNDLRKQAGYAHMQAGPNIVDFDEKRRLVTKPLNAGLWVLSDFPFVKTGKVSFDQKLCSSWDCWANKGIQAVRVKVPGIPFELTIANTHTQAGQTSDPIRVGQLDIAWRFLNRFVSAAEPLFVVGDFNTYPSRTSYQHWMKMTELSSVSDECGAGSVDCVVVARENKGLEFSPDQHFFRSGHVNGYDVEIRPAYAEHLFHEPVNGRLLSDHWGYNVTYEIKW